MARIYNPRFEPLAIWGEDPATGRRVAVGQHESLMQLSIVTPQTRKPQWFPIEHKGDRDALVQAFEKAIVALNNLQNLPDAPAPTTRQSSNAVAAKLPENVVTTDVLANMLKAMMVQQSADTALLIEKSINAVLAPAPKPVASVSGNGQSAVKSL